MAGSHGGGGNTSRGTTRSRDPNPQLVVNVSAEIGRNLVNHADPNAFPQQNPAVIEGSGVVAAPIGEGSSQNQQPKKRARLNPVQNPPPPPQPQVPIEYQIPDMGDIPPHLQGHRLHQLCRPFLRHMAEQAGLDIGPTPGPGVGVNVEVLNGSDPSLSGLCFLRNPGGDALTLGWRELFNRMGCHLVEKQYIDMWFEMAHPPMSIYIQGR